MKYQVEYTPQAVEDLKGLRPTVRSLLYGWIEKNLVDCEDPRHYGSGDPEGGRWRYSIGEYRLLAEIQEGRIIILAIVSGLRRTGSRKNGGANKLSAPSNVFLRSTLRQPVRSIFLLLIIALLTFAFVSKGAEYLLIKQETEELGGYYRSIGVLTTGVSAERDLEADASEAAGYLEASLYVESAERVQSLSAVTDAYNVDTETLNTAYMTADIYFYGTFLASNPYEADPDSLKYYYSDLHSQNYYFTFQIDSFLTGYPENLRYVKEGDYLTLSSPDGYVEPGRVKNAVKTEVRDEKGILLGYIINGDPEFEGEPYADLTDLAGELEQGGRYLIHAVNETACHRYNKLSSEETVFTIAPLTENGLWCYPVAEGEADFGDPALAGVAEAIRRVDDNQHALLFFGAEDVSGLPGLQKEKNSLGVSVAFSESFLTEGRWPDAKDNAKGNQVCAIHSKLASVRGLSVGDTITMTYRELLGLSDEPYPNQPVPYLYQSEDLAREETPTSEAMTYEIVGIYETQTTDEYIYNYLLNFVLVPASTMPQSLMNASDAVKLSEFSFVLTSPEMEDRFIVESSEALSALGFQVRFLPTNYEAFQAAARPMRQSALYNTVIFSTVLAMALCLVVFLYFRMRRKDLAIARALGVPVRRCVRQASAPLLLIGLLGILAGGYAGWRYTLENAGQTLSALSELIEENGAAMAALSAGWLALLLAVCFVPLLLLTLVSASVMARRPVLDQIQDRTAVKEKRTAAQAEQEPAAPITLNLSAIRMEPVQENNDRRKTRMRRNVFLRSTLRQPVRTVLLLLITALLTFSFVSKGAEYLLVKQETEDLSGYYRSIGVLTTGVSAERDLEADASEAANYLEENPYVETVDRIQALSAVADVCNAETETLNIKYQTADIYFYGTYQAYGTYLDYGERPCYTFLFQVDTILTGYPENLRYVEEGGYITVTSPVGYNKAGRAKNEVITTTMVRNPDGTITGTTTATFDPEFEGIPYADLTDLTEELEQGRRYLIRAVNETAYHPFNMISNSEEEGTVFTLGSLTEEGLWYYPVEEGEADFSDPALAGVAESISRTDDNQHALLFFGSEDVSGLPGLQKEKNSLGLPAAFSESFLAEGRWPDAKDNAKGNRVCAIHSKLASVRGLSVGDTITVTYRELLGLDDTPYPDQPVPYLYQPEDLEREETPTSEAMAYEIVGIYETQTTDEYIYNYLLNFVFVSASTMPQSLVNVSDTVKLSEFSFVLTSPEVEDQFIVEAGEALSALGFQARFLPTNYEAFQAAARPMRQSALYNAAIFSAVLAAALCLVVFLYFRMRRKDIAIAHALGVPVRWCVWQASVPLLLVGLIGILAGGYAGWRYTLENAGQTLSALSELIEETGAAMAALSVEWLALLLAVCFVPLLLLTLGGAFMMARKPVLNQIQGGAAAKEKRTAAKAERDAAPAARVALNLSAVRTAPAAMPASGRGIGTAMTLRFVWRHIARAKLKTALSLLLAAVFTVALMAIRISIADNEEKIDRLYNETIVEADLLYAHSGYERLGSGYIQDKTLQDILETGYVLTASPEGVRRALAVLSDPATGEDQAVTRYVRSFEHEDVFLSESGGGSAVTITYFDGWDGSLFAGNWEEQEGPIPAVLPQELYEEYQIQSGDTFVVTCGHAKTFVTAGYYTGSVADMYDGTETPILIPLSAHRALLNNLGLVYARARLALDPCMNRELDTVEAAVQAAADQKGVIKLQTVIWNQELKLAVAPLENNVELMQVLYPVILALSLLAAAGIAALFIMTSAKEAAILRVLGTTKLRSRIMLSLQQTFTTMAGLLVGIFAALVWSRAVRPEQMGNLMGASALCAALYLLAAVIGAAASSAAATGKNPLELLQVKE